MFRSGNAFDIGLQPTRRINLITIIRQILHLNDLTCNHFSSLLLWKSSLFKRTLCLLRIIINIEYFVVFRRSQLSFCRRYLMATGHYPICRLMDNFVKFRHSLKICHSHGYFLSFPWIISGKKVGRNFSNASMCFPVTILSCLQSRLSLFVDFTKFGLKLKKDQPTPGVLYV